MQPLKLPPELIGPPKVAEVQPDIPPRPTPSPQVHPQALAQVARLKSRHHMIAVSFALCVLLPVVLVAGYLFGIARDQYASTVGFSVREEDMGAAMDLLGGLTDIGGSGANDADILYTYIQSQGMVEKIRTQVDLQTAWTSPGDPIFTLPYDHTIEGLVAYWNRMVSVYHDTTSGLIEVRVLAFDPVAAQAITTAIFDESRELINQLTDIAHQDATRFAKDDLATAQTRVVAARQAMTAFRNANLIVDPTADLAGRMGLLNSLIAQKAAALIEFDVLMASPIRANDPRVEAAEQRLQIVDQLIARERQSFGPGNGEGGNYAQLVSQFERLSVESEFAEKSYVAALVGFDAAQADARRTTKYLAAHMPPTRAQLAQYPQRFLIVTLALIALSVVWMIGLLMYYAVRDRR